MIRQSTIARHLVRQRILEIWRTSNHPTCKRIAVALGKTESLICKYLAELSREGAIDRGRVRCLRCERIWISPNKFGRRICGACHRKEIL